MPTNRKLKVLLCNSLLLGSRDKVGAFFIQSTSDIRDPIVFHPVIDDSEFTISQSLKVVVIFIFEY